MIAIRCPPMYSDFYPRPPRGGRPCEPSWHANSRTLFLSTPSARRATKSMHRARQKIIFLSTPSARRATPAQNSLRVQKAGFLSTPSARRATLPHSCGFFVSIYFYPRPPRGGRPSSIFDTFLSILFLSTPSARRATLPVLLRSSYDIRISIHALREEGDWSFG